MPASMPSCAATATTSSTASLSARCQANTPSRPYWLGHRIAVAGHQPRQPSTVAARGAEAGEPGLQHDDPQAAGRHASGSRPSTVRCSRRPRCRRRRRGHPEAAACVDGYFVEPVGDQTVDRRVCGHRLILCSSVPGGLIRHMTDPGPPRQRVRTDPRRRREPVSSGPPDGDQRRTRRGRRRRPARRPWSPPASGSSTPTASTSTSWPPIPTRPRRICARCTHCSRGCSTFPAPMVAVAAGPHVRGGRDAGARPRPGRDAVRSRVLLPARGRSRHSVHAGHERADPRPTADRDGPRGDDDGPPLRRRGGPRRRASSQASAPRTRCSTSPWRGPQERAAKAGPTMGAIKARLYGEAIEALTAS